jgi:L-aminopeptidase/D-esterase-like protein
MVMSELDLSRLRRELDRLARAGPPHNVHDVTLAILSAYGLEVAEAIRDGLLVRIEQAHRTRGDRPDPG